MRSFPHAASRFVGTILAASLALVCLAPLGLAQGDEAGKRLGVRLRSFVPQATGSLYFGPTPAGGVVRLTALNLPRPSGLMPGAAHFVIWAVASGERPMRIGELQTDASGNGGLEFHRPPSFERYSVVVTAEQTADAERPGGVMVFASRAGAVTSFYGEKQQKLTASQRKALDKEMRASMRRTSGVKDFYSEVDDALNSSAGGGRVVELVPGEVAPQAHGIARLASRDENIYVRTIIKRLPLPSEVGARAFVMWGIVPGGRIAYMGSLPAADISDADTYVRVGGIRTDEIDLLVSAENRRPVPQPSGLAALYSSTPWGESGPAFGAIEGVVVDAEGRRVAGALVEPHPDSKAATADTLPVARADAEGRFFLDGLAPGEHKIFASKEEDGYPSADYAFFLQGERSLPRVSVQNKRVTEGVVIRMGPKAGRLVARVVDADTGAPVEGVQVVIARADDPDIYASFGVDAVTGGFDHLIPALPLTLTATAPGYRDWHYGEDGTKTKAQVLKLSPGGIQELSIYLRRAAK